MPIKRCLPLFTLIAAAFLSISISAQEPLEGPAACLTRETASPPILPPDYRLVLQRPDQDALQLVNPADGSESAIPNTEGTRLVLPLENGHQMLVFHKWHGLNEWRVMSFDGSQSGLTRRFGENYDWSGINNNLTQLALIPSLNPSPLRREGLQDPSLRSGEGAGGGEHLRTSPVSVHIRLGA